MFVWMSSSWSAVCNYVSFKCSVESAIAIPTTTDALMARLPHRRRLPFALANMFATPDDIAANVLMTSQRHQRLFLAETRKYVQAADRAVIFFFRYLSAC